MAAVAVIPLTTSAEQTEARWFTSVSAPLPDASTDRFTSRLVDRPSERGQVTNAPAVTASSNAERHQGWTNVLGATVRAGALGGQDLAKDIGLQYSVTAPGGTCNGATSPYWTAQLRGPMTLDTAYNRPSDRVGAAVLGPGQRHDLCMTFPYAGSDTNFLLKNAGRDLIVRTQVGLRSEAPATWDSAPETVDSTYRVAFPRPTPRSNSFAISQSCDRRGSNIELRWAWPDSETITQSTSPAVDRWESYIRRRGSNDTWALQSQTLGSERTLAIPTNSFDLFSSSEIKIVAVLDAKGTYWVESTQLIYVYKSLFFGTYCDGVGTNDAPNPGGPVVLP